MNWYKTAQAENDAKTKDAFLKSVEKSLPPGGTVRFEDYGPRYLELADITALNPGKGWGSAAMKTIVENARRYNINLMLLPVGEPGSEKHELLARFYERFGFQDAGDGVYHLRSPKRNAQLDKKMNWYKKSNNVYQYVGNCGNIFDHDTGNCKIDIFSDVSDFAYKDENAEEIDKEDFESFVKFPNDFPKEIQDEIFPKRGRYPNIKYYFYDGNIFVLYNEDTDMHYFWSKS